MEFVLDFGDSTRTLSQLEREGRPWAGVIGDPIAHSLSPALHTAAYEELGLSDWKYGRACIKPEELEAFFTAVCAHSRRSGLVKGLSVTMPHKQSLMSLTSQNDGLAKAVGALNTVGFLGGGLSAGFNTDVYGVVEALKDSLRGVDLAAGDGEILSGREEEERRASLLVNPGSSAVIVGTGATASSTLAALGELKIFTVTVVGRPSRRGQNVFTAGARLGITPQFVPVSQEKRVLEAIEQAEVVISTVPRGSLDDLLSRVELRAEQCVLDVVYAPKPGILGEKAALAGARVAPGWNMLVHQARLQAQLFSSRTPSLSVMRRALLRELER